MSSYPEAPEGWTPVARRAVGPFTTHLTFRRPDGSTSEWSSRTHRKHASRLSRVAAGHERVWWAPERVSWWIGVLFAVGSSCFLIAPFPGFVELVGSGVDGMVFFVGSVFFTSAAALQCLETFNADRGPGRGDPGRPADQRPELGPADGHHRPWRVELDRYQPRHPTATQPS